MPGMAAKAVEDTRFYIGQINRPWLWGGTKPLSASGSEKNGRQRLRTLGHQADVICWIPRLPDPPGTLKGTGRDVWLSLCAGQFPPGEVKVGGQLPDQPNHPLEKPGGHEQGLAVGI
jgi:hypothetical protein